ncbi:hypothetical protein [Flavobacterium sp. '19STA2R22 D10 B1']|uniref:hypothetical protein n=1 Tax=Flavobacterium aerium TaxID=3037261 RepID=UPI00278C29BC|nr:hypothetical protein [Flavobacterium sp. '19STA2R22 D10 B1']
MVKLADWYDNKCRKAYSYTYVGGENPIKAFEWYEKAASKDSPVAMYRLGMIYKYSSTQDGSESYAYAKRVHVEYEIAKDESKAFEWFSKSINPNYVESLFSTSKKIKTNFWNWKDTFSAAKASFFHPDSYKQLALFYKQAKVVPKDKEMAKKLVVAYKIYVNINNF